MGIFDDIVHGISREFSRVQERSQEMMQSYSLKGQIRTLEGRKTAALLEIGRLVYEKYQLSKEISEDTLKSQTDEIVGYEHEITVLKAEMEKLKAQYDPDASAAEKTEARAGYSHTPGFTCPHCQAPANSEKSFCPACGGVLGQEGQEVEVKVEEPASRDGDGRS